MGCYRVSLYLGVERRLNGSMDIRNLNVVSLISDIKWKSNILYQICTIEGVKFALIADAIINFLVKEPIASIRKCRRKRVLRVNNGFK